ncbi:MAG: hypothetical protein J2P46_00200 [Zavarzinella sp.]|nr:hypothetical protein [Zavarzinella sp.]
MQIPVLVEPLPDGRGFRARAGEPLDLSAEGPTKAAAIRELQQAARGRLAAGAEVVPMDLVSGNPWDELGGFLPDDEATRQWLDALRENRRRANESPDGLLPTE